MTAEHPSFLPREGAMASAIAAHAWSRTPLGPIEAWPELLKTAVALMPESRFPQAVIWGPELVTLYNDAFRPILGAKPAPLGRPFSEIWSEAWQDVAPIAAAAFEGRATYIENFPVFIDRHGRPELAHFTFCYSPIRDAQGRVVGMLDTVTETTATMLATRRLAFLDLLGRTIAGERDADAVMAATTSLLAGHLGLSNCAYADMDADQDGFTIRGNWAAEGSPSIVGHYSLADFGTLAVRRLRAGEPLVVNDNLAELAPHEAATFQNIGIAATICMPLIREGRLTALMAIHDKVPRLWSDYELALLRDVTERSWAYVERVRADADLRRVAAALEELNATLEARVAERTRQLEETEAALRQSQKMEAIGQLTGGIAHDFNNLLAAVVGSLDLILHRAGDAERVRRHAEAGLAAAGRGTKLTAQLLAFSRKQKIELKPLFLSALLRGMTELLRRTLGPMIRLRLELREPDLRILTDATQLELAVLNLAINARDAMPEGGDLHIASSVARIERDGVLRPGSYALLTVADTGEGMPPEVLARAFDPFFTTKGVGKGTGLGLSQVYGIAHQAGGTVRMESRPGAGTTVRIYLPLTALEPEAEPAERKAEARAGKASILVVDDDADVREMLVTALETLGFSATEAGSGTAGLAALEAARPDLVILDYAMPDLTGAEVARLARKRWPALPIVFASGYADTATIESVAGTDAIVLRKPFRIGDLGAVIAGALGRPELEPGRG
ncbi:hybrid sensor histidine kinase/response regulator [Pseudoroseomonas rhizosphaerae]|uniref:histidine kinase n=1 Tax=Teichococcus rhizosphaerae TaxID=1335062 RepID=A0A2C7A4P3_9PROT|nr:ATP-binding protein [Pseudoroseomonas rhizosphaerae]PHK93320.1 hybrid sensor histidine kinase/response regulator [Pseudoroseomonas rhizosphaerae]